MKPLQEQSLESLQILMWDLYKEVWGVRPRDMKMDDKEELIKDIEQLLKML